MSSLPGCRPCDDQRLGQEFVVEVRRLLREVMLALFDIHNPRRRVELLVRLALVELTEAEDAATFMPMPSDARARRVAELVLADPAQQQAARGSRPQGRRLAAAPSTRPLPRRNTPDLEGVASTRPHHGGDRAPGDREQSVKSVAARLGFASPAAFAHAFRSVIGHHAERIQRRAAQGLSSREARPRERGRLHPSVESAWGKNHLV